MPSYFVYFALDDTEEIAYQQPAIVTAKNEQEALEIFARARISVDTDFQDELEYRYESGVASHFTHSTAQDVMRYAQSDVDNYDLKAIHKNVNKLLNNVHWSDLFVKHFFDPNDDGEPRPHNLPIDMLVKLWLFQLGELKAVNLDEIEKL